MFESLFSDKSQMPSPEQALPGRETAVRVAPSHFVLGSPMYGPWPQGHEEIIFGMGCFWGAERKFWENADVFSSQVGYAAGFTPNPSYEEVCSGKTGHNEVVCVVFDPKVTPLAHILKIFWENHDPTQGMRQGNDRGTQYRSGIYTTSDAQFEMAQASKVAFQDAIKAAGYPDITTEIMPAPTFYYAEDYHQQYLGKNPNGYCGLGGTGVSCPIGFSLT